MQICNAYKVDMHPPILFAYIIHSIGFSGATRPTHQPADISQNYLVGNLIITQPRKPPTLQVDAKRKWSFAFLPATSPTHVCMHAP